ncbi:MAG: hypothetical protein HYU86_02920 [Chloroflexi bacterium]|nr:hypothetical protein [Chloroflexota bacterium]
MNREVSYWQDILGKRLTRRRALGTAARMGIGLAGASLLACAPAAKKVELESITYGYIKEGVTLDGHIDFQIGSMSMGEAIYDGLTYLNTKKELEPALAESWKTIDDKTWEFKLRKGVKFHNGEPFNAQAVKWNVTRIQNPKHTGRLRAVLDTIQGVEAVDEATVRITTKQPDPLIPVKFFQTKMVPPKYLQDKGDEILASQPIGTGPYKFVEWPKDVHILMQRNDEYWGPKPAAKKIYLKAIPTQSARVAALKTGAVDIAYSMTKEDIDELTKDKNLDLYKAGAPSSTTMRMSFGSATAKPLLDKRVRQAILYAVDWDAIAKNIYGGLATRTASLPPFGYLGYDSSLKPYPYDPKKAKELLAAAGLSNGFEVAVDDYQPGTLARQGDMVQAIVNYLSAVGIKPKFKMWEYSAWRTHRSKALADKTGFEGIFYTSWADETFDGDGYVYNLYHTKGTFNFAVHSNPKVDELLDKGRTTISPEGRKKVYADLSKLLYDEAVELMGLMVEDTYAYNKTKIRKMAASGWMTKIREMAFV